MHEPDQQNASLEQSLRAYYHLRFSQSHGPAPALDELWRQIAPRLGAQSAARPWWNRLLTHREGKRAPAPVVSLAVRTRPAKPSFAIVALFSLVVLLVGGVIYAEAVMRPSASIGISPPAGHLPFVDVNLTKSLGNTTIHVRKAYADANNVILLSTADYTGPATQAPASSSWGAVLTTNGTEIPFIAAGTTPVPYQPEGTAEATTTGGAAMPWQSVSSMWRFNGAAIQGNPATLRLQLRLTPPASKPGDPARLKGASSAAPLTVSFTVPFHAGKEVAVHQTAISKGHALTLDRVVIAPSETRFYFRDDPSTYAYAAELHVGGRVYPFESGATGGAQDRHEYALAVNPVFKIVISGPGVTPTASGQSTGVPIGSPSVSSVPEVTQTPLDQMVVQSLEGQTGTWRVSVTQLYDFTTGAFSGDWEFTFMVD